MTQKSKGKFYTTKEWEKFQKIKKESKGTFTPDVSRASIPTSPRVDGFMKDTPAMRELLKRMGKI